MTIHGMHRGRENAKWLICCFFPIYADATIGAHDGARCATDARVCHFLTEGVTFVVYFVLGESKGLGGTCYDT